MKVFEKFNKTLKEGSNSNNYILTLSLKKSKIMIAALCSIIMAIAIFLPVVILCCQFVMIYGYIFLSNKIYLILGLTFVCLFFLLFNAIISLINLKILKCYLPNDTTLIEIKYMPFFIYQFLNPWFIIFLIVVSIIFGGVI